MTEFWSTGHGQLAVIALAVLFALGLILMVLWIVLPFGVFGTKPLLRDLLAAQLETNRKLEEIRQVLHRIETTPSPWEPRPPEA